MSAVADSRMSLGEHLAELRTRLVRVLVAASLLAGVGWWQAEAIHGWLMRPVLLALPAGSEALVYTSAVEELNVLLRVGLYAGACLATPIALRELWGFVAPGLHAHERRLAGPFVLAGTAAFAAGVLFCYVAMLPPMFTFLLRDAGELEREREVAVLELREAVALQAARGGELERAGDEARRALATWDQREAPDRALARIRPPDPAHGALARLQALERLIEVAPVQREAVALQRAGIEAWAAGDLVAADAACQAAVAELAGPGGGPLDDLWRLEAALAGARVELEALRWTRPMLAMDTQLDLVVLFLLATGAVFELPLVLALLGMVGLVSSSFLMRYQRHAVVACVVAAAFITPTADVFNLALMTVPMLACFELGVLAVWLVERRRARRDPRAGRDGPRALPETDFS